MKIYEIDSKILNCIDFETGEILNIEKLKSLQIAKKEKIEGVACYYKQIFAEISALKDEKKWISSRIERKEKIAESIKNYLNEILAGENFETSKTTVFWRKSTSIEIEDINKIPEKYIKKKVELSADKKRIKEDLVELGEIIGAKLVKNNNIQIN